MADGLTVAKEVQYTIGGRGEITGRWQGASAAGAKQALGDNRAAGERVRPGDRDDVITLLREGARAGDDALQFQNHALVLLIGSGEEIGGVGGGAAAVVQAVDAVEEILAERDGTRDVEGDVAADRPEGPGDVIIVGGLVARGDETLNTPAGRQVDGDGGEVRIGLVGGDLQRSAIEAQGGDSVASSVDTPPLDTALLIGRDLDNIGDAEV